MSEIPMYPSEMDCPCRCGTHANPYQCVAYLEQVVSDQDQKLNQIRAIIENYGEDEFLSADRALGEIHKTVTP